MKSQFINIYLYAYDKSGRHMYHIHFGGQEREITSDTKGWINQNLNSPKLKDDDMLSITLQIIKID